MYCMKLCSAIIVFIFSVNVLSQNISDSAFLLPKIIIYEKKNNYGCEKYDSNKFILNDSVLIADPVLYNYRININDINKISFRNGTHFWSGAAFGAIAGFAIGFAIFNRSFNFGGGGSDEFHFDSAIWGGIITSIPFGLIGGLFGLLSPKYDDYDISKISKENKYRYLKNVFREKSVEEQKIK